jgi:hypothetical protein
MSNLLPWLLIGPLLTVSLALPLWQLSRWPWLGWLAGTAGGLAALVMLAAFVANLRSRRRPR